MLCTLTAMTSSCYVLSAAPPHPALTKLRRVRFKQESQKSKSLEMPCCHSYGQQPPGGENLGGDAGQCRSASYSGFPTRPHTDMPTRPHTDIPTRPHADMTTRPHTDMPTRPHTDMPTRPHTDLSKRSHPDMTTRPPPVPRIDVDDAPLQDTVCCRLTKLSDVTPQGVCYVSCIVDVDGMFVAFD